MIRGLWNCGEWGCARGVIDVDGRDNRGICLWGNVCCCWGEAWECIDCRRGRFQCLADHRSGMLTWQRQSTQWDCLNNRSFLRDLGNLQEFRSVGRRIGVRLQRRFFRLRRWKARARFKLDVATIVVAIAVGHRDYC